MTAAIIAQGLTKIYREGRIEVTAVSAINLTLQKGELVGIFGPSGSGKTTLLSLLGCILQPTSGSLRIFGNEVVGLGENELPDIRKKYISFIFQGFNLFPALTAHENVMLLLHIKGIRGKGAVDMADRLLTDVGLADRMHFLPRDLSGGQKQRVAIARAFSSDAPIIIADEPTGNLDHDNGRKVMEILRRLANDQGKCIILATHDSRIDNYFDRILVMEDGKFLRENHITS